MKPFDLEAAKRGEPIINRQGVEARFLGHVAENEEFERIAVAAGGTIYGCSETGLFARYDPETCLDLFMAPKPKVKREGWVNIYPGPMTGKHIHASKQIAIDGAGCGCSATVRIEWEEEA